MMQAFIRDHREEDVRRLALKAAQYPGIDMPYALQQIAGWQAARKKLPAWAATEGIVYPPHLSMEQCSSEATAKYKLLLCRRLTGGNLNAAATLVDLTGGFGVDFSFMAKAFERAVYVERQEHLCEAATTNFRLLGLNQAKIVRGDGIDYLREMENVCMIYLDPARRNDQGARTFAICDCTPDVITLRDELLEKAEWVIVKLSPMLDWHKALEDLGRQWVREVHIVSVNNECKELLVVMSKHKSEEPVRVFCADDEDRFSFCFAEKQAFSGDDSSAFNQPFIQPSPGDYLYEPNASVMKAGCFEQLQQLFHVSAVGKNSHLFISSHFIGDFPGRKFHISSISSMNKKEVKTMLSGIVSANVAVRNFPLSVAELRKRLKLKDGGEHYLFGTTAEKGKHLLLLCHKP